MIIRRLERQDDRTGFCSGNDALDTFLRRYAGQNQTRHRIGSTFVAVEEGDRRVLGFVSLAVGEIQRALLPVHQRRGVPAFPLPILRLTRLAVDREAQGRGIGERLTHFALNKAIDLDASLSCFAVIVDAKPGAESYYGRFGFERLQDTEDVQVMILLMRTLLRSVRR